VADRTRAPRPASLRRSILVWLVLATAAIGAVALLDTRTQAQRIARDVSDRVLVGSAMAIAEGVDVDAEGAVAVAIPFSALDMLSSTAQDQVFYRIDGPTGLLTGYPDLVPAPVARGAATGLADATYRGMAVRTATITRDLTSGEGPVPFAVTVAETTLARDALARSILARSAQRIGGLIAGAALVAWAAATYALRPLHRLSRTIAARAPHDLTPISADAPVELHPVLGAMNGFLGRLSQAMAALQNFAGNANHQIRTPLTVARTQLAMAAGPPGAGSPLQAQALDKVDAALVRIERVLEQLLLLARIEATGATPDLRPVDVAALARGLTAEHLPVAVERRTDLGYDGPRRAMALSDEILLGELLGNLVTNAVLHCPPDTMITVQVGATTGAGLAVRVSDTGPPVPDPLFDLLRARLDPQPGPAGPRAGTRGLGVHIVAEIARALRAQVGLDRGPGGQGLVWTVMLPALVADG
jgi:two-component system sensor histidine kinase TctE